MKVTYPLSEIKTIAQQLVAQFDCPKTLLFYGNMGVGKTTLIKEIALQLGVTEATTSPTFSLVNEYKGTFAKIFHFDFYRIEDEIEVYDIGIEDYFYQNAWCLVEWPEKIPNIIPEEAIAIEIMLAKNGNRVLEIKSVI